MTLYCPFLQRGALESQLKELQKEFDSLSEAHNSLEQLNSNWSERNMEQKNKIESMLKEANELRIRLTHAEESEVSQKEMKQNLKWSFENEVLT